MESILQNAQERVVDIENDMLDATVPLTHNSATDDESAELRISSDMPKIVLASARRFDPKYVMVSNISHVDLGKRIRRFFGISRSPISVLWCVNDCCGWTCAIVTWLLLIYAQFVMYSVVLSDDTLVFGYHARLINLFFWESLWMLAFFSHFRAMFSDPGAVPFGNCTKENFRKLGLTSDMTIVKCPKCICIKPSKCHHCSICRRCIMNMDHHCPWVNNCVGEKNQKFFVLFCLYIASISWYALILCVCFIVNCVGARTTYHRDATAERTCSANYAGPGTMLLVIFLVFESVLFGLFTVVMCSTQLHAICTNTSTIDKHAGRRGNDGDSFKQVFGSMRDWRCFSPFHSSPICSNPIYESANADEMNGLKIM